MQSGAKAISNIKYGDTRGENCAFKGQQYRAERLYILGSCRLRDPPHRNVQYIEWNGHTIHILIEPNNVE